MNKIISPPSPTEVMRNEVLRGLSRTPKRLPCKYFYDDRGCRLFDEICELPEYYLTRAELDIMRRHANEMASLAGPGGTLVELGSGSSVKTRLLLDRWPGLRLYVPVDIAADHLERTAAALSEDYPRLEVQPLSADFTQPFALPQRHPPTVVYFPGSTLGNFRPARAERLLEHMARLASDDGGVLLGVDLDKDPQVIEAAYNDRAGVTAEFNLNLLRRINRELGGDFPLDGFSHRALYRRSLGRLEMHLVSQRAQQVRVAGRTFDFAEGETICTEYSHKYRLDRLEAMAERAGLGVVRVWTDPRRFFAVLYLRRLALV